MSNTTLPLITISISCYNSQDTVARAVESALAQDWENKEIIIADDGSSDETVLEIQKKIKGHDNARLIIYEKNKGFAGSLNTLITEAKGEFFAIFDDDDISAPNRVRAQYERIVNYEKQYNTDKVICHVARTQQFQNGYERYEQTMGTKGGLAPHGEAVADRIIIGKLSYDIVGSCANCSRMARIGVFRDMNGYDVTMKRGEDTDFNVRFAISGGHFVGIAEPLVTQTMTMGQEKKLDQERKAELFLLNKHKNYLKGKGWYDFSISWLEARYAHLNNKKLELLKRISLLLIKNPIKVIYKFYWAVPAHSTRRDFKKWHHAKLNGQD